MSEKDDFSTLLGKNKGIKKTKQQDASPDFYRPKPLINKKTISSIGSFEHSEISQLDYDIGIEDTIEFRRQGVQNSLLKKLAKGEPTVYESIDLHGMTTPEAEIYIASTIDSLRYHHMICIRIVHGKGYNAGEGLYNKPKLKNFIARYLAEHQRVLAYTSCPANRGGTGAVYVLISRFSE